MLVEYDISMDMDINDGLVLLFVKDYSIPSMAMEPIVDKLSEEFDDICFTAISVDDVGELAEEYNIRSSPAILFLDNGNVVYKIHGIITENNLREKVKRILL
jgi:thioredoxin 1